MYREGLLVCIFSLSRRTANFPPGQILHLLMHKSILFSPWIYYVVSRILEIAFEVLFYILFHPYKTLFQQTSNANIFFGKF